MQTLTVRELSRETARVLNTCDHDGQVVIRHTDGREYLLAPTQPRRKQGRRQLPDFSKRMRSKFGDRVFSEVFVGAILNKGEH